MIAPSDTSLAPDFAICGCGSPFAHSLVDFELFHVNVYALIAGKLPNRVWRTPIVGQAPHVHVVVVPGIET